MDEVEVPSYFLCPISLQIMRDPVTLPTGISYDRESIERWIFSEKHTTCPVTKQPLLSESYELTPNHTLRRLIQTWCSANAWAGIERLPTPRLPVNKAEVLQLLDEAVKSQAQQLDCLKKLRMIVSESYRNRQCVEDCGAADFLAYILKNSITGEICDAALGILCSLQITEQGLVDLITKHGDFMESLTLAMQRSPNCQSRVYAILLLKSLLSVIAPARLVAVKKELFQETVNVLGDEISHQATKAALKVLAGLCPWGRNRIKAAAAGAVTVLIERLLEEPERRTCELMLVVLDQLCGCAEGRAELVAHAAGMAVVARKVLRVSKAATERAVRVLYSVAKYSATAAVLQEMLQVGAVAKLCVVAHAESGMKAREKAREILRWHSRVWRNSHCLAHQLQGSYPC